MPGRHVSAQNPAPPRRRRLRSILLGILAATAVAAAAIVVGPRVLSSADDCDTSTQLRVVANPQIFPIVERRAADLASADDNGFTAAGTCVTITVTESDDDAAAAALTADEADLWIPRSLTWTTASVDPETVVNLGSVAVSPLVVATPRTIAQGIGWPDADLSWSSVTNGDAGAVLPDPNVTPEGRAALAAVQSTLGAEADQAQIAAALTQVASAAPSSASDALRATTASDTPVFTVASERSVIEHNASGATGVVAFYPDEGTYAFDHPALLGTESSVDQQIAEAFVADLTSDATQARIHAASMRTADGTAASSAGLVDGTSQTMPETLAPPDPEALSGIMRQWSALSIQMQMLGVVDVSGSMDEPVGDSETTRIDLTRDATKTALGFLPPTASVGIWAFSTGQDPPNDYVQLVDIGPLEEELDGTTRSELIANAADSFPDLVQGGTGLYDTALAAFQHMRATYDPDRINSVVLITDGRNEDDLDTISLDTLLSTLRAQFDPARPIPIITIGVSEDADMDALRQISEATGTQAYQAEDPRDIEQVFLQAVVERQCRPNC